MKRYIEEELSETNSETEMEEDIQPQQTNIIYSTIKNNEKKLPILSKDDYQLEKQGGELTDEEIILDIIKLAKQDKFGEARREIEKDIRLLEIIAKDNMLLHEATYHGAIDFLKWLHEKNIDLDIHKESGNDLTHLAAERGHLAILEWFDSIKVPLNDKGKDGLTLSLLASGEGHNETAELLAKKSCPIRDNQEVEIVEKIQELEIRVEPPVYKAPYATSQQKNHLELEILSPIFQAIRIGDSSIIKTFIEKDKFNLHKVYRGLSLLDKAMKYSQFEIAKHLAINGGNPENMFPNRVKSCFVNTDKIIVGDKSTVDVIIRIKTTPVVYEQKITASDIDSLSINGPAIFTAEVKVPHCRIYKDLYQHEISASIASNNSFQLGEVVFEKGLHCDDIQIVGELAHMQINNHYYI